MAEHDCEHCKLRNRYDENPKSMVGRIWRWHINFCPGWKKYYFSLSDSERAELDSKYNFTKYKEVH
ncbi:MAG: hypothetical protein B6D72_15595 [gamma proteobacterium symbiont of Ctena orbiculata]|nr:hypothetical protein [Candidatus Thiodiazotropha taylori]PUB81706.1 MAG: hypothetical protein DBP00_18495 [gamma proteobacterium symbiont of Ctena orbiculata]PVV08903.1 MAG: hypothetical protein B6D72_15595 [gamma proteobacterium symbiont of Ctena orbiculata]PVV09994.1 MAG: hypothetical protein B6D82_13250 [gamma proteobacterium symbiont of Ctena orbiculata]PVV17260.1 MAG: hypothetical protein B6D74_18490 [gamma proteobacterium symbiont of Ctena orbiculata]